MVDTGRRLPSIESYALPQEAELPSSRADWALEPAKTALLVHDMQNYFVDAFVGGQAPISPIVDNISQLLTAARAGGVPVFYTAQNGDQDLRDRGLQADLWGPGMQHIPEHQQIISPLEPMGEDFVLVKHRYSAFQRSNFKEMMRARGRNQLIICGVYAHIGCLMTAGEAFQHDIQPFFAGDAVGDFSRTWHDTALALVANSYGIVRSARQIIEVLT